MSARSCALRYGKPTKLLPVIDRRLRRAHRTGSLGNKKNPLDELVFIQLSIRTPEKTYKPVYSKLRRALGGQWSRLLDLSNREAVALLREGGMARLKVSRLTATLRSIDRMFGIVSLAPLRRMSDIDAERMLLSLPGVGLKVARCVLLYSLDRKVFPVDSHCFRVMRRLGFVLPGRTVRQCHNSLQQIVPPNMRASLHVNLIHHGRRTCRAATPQCTECCLADLCPSRTKLLHASTR